MKQIGLDIDQTMYFLDVIENASRLTGLNFTSEDVTHWLYDKDTNRFPQWFVNIVYAHFDDPVYMGNLDLNIHVKQKLNKWKEMDWNLHIISARRPCVRIATIEMLNKDFGVGFFDTINFVDYKTNEKIPLFKELDLDIWIDDNPIDLEKARMNKIKTFAIYNRYTKYNHKKVDYILDYEKAYKEKIGIFKVEHFGEIQL